MVLDGRDIGTKVLPDATLKVYLTASPEVRAKRRFDELTAKGIAADYDKVLSDVIASDHQDSTRAIDPLRPAEDAVVIDTTNLTRPQVVDACSSFWRPGYEGFRTKPPPFLPALRLFDGSRILSVPYAVLPVRYHHPERAKLDAPYIVIGNHLSMIDPIHRRLRLPQIPDPFPGQGRTDEEPDFPVSCSAGCT